MEFEVLTQLVKVFGFLSCVACTLVSMHYDLGETECLPFLGDSRFLRNFASLPA